MKEPVVNEKEEEEPIVVNQINVMKVTSNVKPKCTLRYIQAKMSNGGIETDVTCMLDSRADTCITSDDIKDELKLQGPIMKEYIQTLGGEVKEASIMTTTVDITSLDEKFTKKIQVTTFPNPMGGITTWRLE